MKKKRILFVAEELETNGAVRSLLALLKALPTDKYDLSLFLFMHGGSMMEEIPTSVNLLPESLPYAIQRMPLKEAIKLSLKKFRIDLLVYRLLVAFQRYLDWEYRLWAFLPKIEGEYDVVCGYTDGFVAPTIIRKVKAQKKCSWIHAPYSNWAQKQSVYDALAKMDVCVPVSKTVGIDFQDTTNISIPQHIIHNITDAETCKKRSKELCEIPRAEENYRIVSVGRVSNAKNFEIIPSVAKKLKEKGVQFEWYVVGNGELFKEISNNINVAGLPDCVHLIGARPNPMPWIKSADVFVNPSRFEAWGMTVSEALCLGKAVIVSDIPVFKEQITDGENGIICHVTPENLANDIERVLKDDALRHKLEKNAMNYPFTKESVVKEFDEMIEKLCLPRE